MLRMLREFVVTGWYQNRQFKASGSCCFFLFFFGLFIKALIDLKTFFFLNFFFLCLWWVSFFSQLFEYFLWNQSLAKEKKTNFCCRFSSSNYLVMFSWSSAGCGFEFHNSASKKEFWGFFIEKSVSIMCCGI